MRKIVQVKDLYATITIPWDDIEKPNRSILKEMLLNKEISEKDKK